MSLSLVLAVALGGFGQVADGFSQFFLGRLFDLLDRRIFDQALQEAKRQGRGRAVAAEQEGDDGVFTTVRTLGITEA